jgi:hypothetical protein
MGLSERVWEAFTTTIKLADKVGQLSHTVKTQQAKIEDLTGRLIRLETAMELALLAKRPRAMEDKR